MTTDATIPFDPTAPAQRENPFDVLALARREQPVFHAPALDLWVVTRHEEVLAVLKDHRTFSSAGALVDKQSAPCELPMRAAFGDGDLSSLYLTAGDGKLYRAKDSGHKGAK